MDQQQCGDCHRFLWYTTVPKSFGRLLHEPEHCGYCGRPKSEAAKRLADALASRSLRIAAALAESAVAV